MVRAEASVAKEDEAVTAGQRAYDRLRRMIVVLELAPGSPLSEAGIMEQTGIGRTPLREALRRLADEGFITIYPRRGSVVRQLGLADVQQVFDSRSLVEPANARAAAAHIDEGGWRDLEDVARSVERAEQQGDFPAFMDADTRLHLTIARIGNNQLLAGFTDRLLTLNQWLWFTHMTRYGMSASDFASHAEILEAIGASDGDRAATAMANHVQTSRDLLRFAL